MDIVTPLGWEPENVRRAASLGQSMDAGLADLHVRLDSGQFDAVTGIMRESPDESSRAGTDESGAAPTGHEAEPTNALGVPLSRVTAFDKSFSRKEMEAALQQLDGSKKLGKTFSASETDKPNSTTRPSFKDIIRRLAAFVKE